MKTRFAPAPTGYLHIGGARTALFNWLYAKREGGRFLLRIEDTDIKRSTRESSDAILEGLRWLGITWDEGPYYQSERLSVYRDYGERLLVENKAYLCFCTEEELKEKRERQLREKVAPVYDGTCKRLTEKEKRELSKKRPASIRFSVPKGKIFFSDLIRGDMEFSGDTIGDFIIMRSDRIPTYNFSCVVDDHLMGITHILRGEEHLSNTPKQILIYRALGFPLPSFGHLPLILGEDRSPLSKRHGAVDISYYRREGFLPEALLNYIVLLGFSTPDSKQIMDVSEMVSEFSLDRINRSPAVFDINKLLWMNGEYIRMCPTDRLVELSGDILKDRDDSWKRAVIELYRERIKRVSDIEREADFLLQDEIAIDREAEAKILRRDGVVKSLEAVRSVLEGIEPFNRERTEVALRALAERLGIKTKEIFHPLRVAVTGRAVSPPLFDTLELLGKDRVLSRIDKAILHLASA